MSELRILKIRVEHLPPPELNPNRIRSEHWTVRHQAAEIAKAEIGWLAKAAGWTTDEPAMQRARISYIFGYTRTHDLDNLLGACKAWQDGILEVGVFFYDDSRHLEIGSVKQNVSAEEYTEITVEELE